jgi:TRAP-type uncharacterized transport system substrate-binding protein
MSLLLLFNFIAAPSTTKAITNNNNTTVTHIGSGVYRIEKTGGTTVAYDAGAVSSSGVSGDFVLEIRPRSGSAGE